MNMAWPFYLTTFEWKIKISLYDNENEKIKRKLLKNINEKGSQLKKGNKNKQLEIKIFKSYKIKKPKNRNKKNTKYKINK